MDFIQKSLSSNDKGRVSNEKVIIRNEKANYNLVRGSLDRLKPGQWLNDDIINAYVGLINQRTAASGLKNVFIMNTFFFTMLEDMARRQDYSFVKLQRIIKRSKVDLQDFRLVIIPINIR